jgi:hypothetical protein
MIQSPRKSQKKIKALRDSEARFRATFENAAVGIAGRDRELLDGLRRLDSRPFCFRPFIVFLFVLFLCEGVIN